MNLDNVHVDVRCVEMTLYSYSMDRDVVLAEPYSLVLQRLKTPEIL